MTKKQVNESIRIAKEGIGECWDDMAGVTGQTSEGQGEGPMTVTINMPGKNISVTTDSADEIANILKLAGIQVGGVSADGEMPAEMPAEMPGEEPAVMYVGAEPTVSADQVPGDNDGDGDHDMTDHEIESGEESEEEESEDEEETKEAVGDTSYTSKGGKVTQTATGLTHQAGSGTYGGTETDAEEEARKKADDEAAKKEVGEAIEEIDEESARILQLAGVTNEAQSAAQKAAFAKMIAKKNGGKSDDDSDSKDDNKKPDADGDGKPDWADKKDDKEVKEEAPATNSIYGQGVYETSYARILELAGLIEGTDDLKKISTAALKAASGKDLEADKKSGVSAAFSTAQIKAELKRREVAEGKLANSPEGTSMSEPQLFDNLPSARGQAAGRKDFGANRANGQGENPMGDGTHTVTVEEQFKTAMGEYRKFVAESISRKK